MTRFALDTNTVSYYLRQEGGIAERLIAFPPSAIVLPSVVVFELHFGLRRRGLRTTFDQLSDFIDATGVVDFDIQAADHAARIRIELEAKGQPIGSYDLLIAATARRHGCTLVTHNTREFGRVPGLMIEDWY